MAHLEEHILLIAQRLSRIEYVLDRLAREEHHMAVTQQQFDTDLAALVSAIDNLIDTVNTALAAKGEADLTAEDQSVQQAAQKVADELAKLAPAPAEEPTA